MARQVVAREIGHDMIFISSLKKISTELLFILIILNRTGPRATQQGIMSSVGSILLRKLILLIFFSGKQFFFLNFFWIPAQSES